MTIKDIESLLIKTKKEAILDIDEFIGKLNAAVKTGETIKYSSDGVDWVVWSDEGRGEPALGAIPYEWKVFPKLPGTPFTYENIPYEAIFKYPEKRCDCGNSGCKEVMQEVKGKVDSWAKLGALVGGMVKTYDQLATDTLISWDNKTYYPAVAESLVHRPHQV